MNDLPEAFEPAANFIGLEPSTIVFETSYSSTACLSASRFEGLVEEDPREAEAEP